jgi:hypothetical protein
MIAIIALCIGLVNFIWMAFNFKMMLELRAWRNKSIVTRPLSDFIDKLKDSGFAVEEQQLRKELAMGNKK